MAKNSIRDYSATNSSNTDIQSIDISEGCSPAGINNAIREVMADLKDVSTGAVALESPAADSLSVTGDLTVDTNTLYVDSTNNRVGIGTSPAGQLHVFNSAAGEQYISSSNSAIRFVSTGGENYIQSGTATTGSSPAPLIFTNVGGTNETMRIDSSGNVSLGNGKFLQFKDSGGTARDVITIDAFNGLNINSAGGGSAAPIVFKSNNAETMRIDTSGNLLVGTTSTFAGSGITPILTVQKSNGSAIGATGIGSAEVGIATRPSANHNYYAGFFLNSSGTGVGNIQVTPTSTAYNTSSDYRLKTAVTYDWDATTRLKQLRPARFEWISDGDDAVPVDGFLAHEVQDVVPEAVTGTHNAMRDEEYQVSAATGDIYTPAIEAVLDEDGNEVTPAVAEVIHSTDVERPEELAEGQQWRETTAAVMGTRSVPDYQGIDQSKLVPLLVKTIQELEARITALEAN